MQPLKLKDSQPLPPGVSAPKPTLRGVGLPLDSVPFPFLPPLRPLSPRSTQLGRGTEGLG